MLITGGREVGVDRGVSIRDLIRIPGGNIAAKYSVLGSSGELCGCCRTGGGRARSGVVGGGRGSRR